MRILPSTLFFTFLLFVGFSANASSPFASKWKELDQTLRPRIEACLTQNRTIVQGAITKVDAPKNLDEYVAFVQDESAAINFIRQFDVNKLTAAEELQYLQILLANCNPDTIKEYEQLQRQRKMCVEIFDDLNFLRGLIFANKNYVWSAKTKQMATEKIFTYLKHVSNWPTPIFGYLEVAGSILESMIDYHLVGEEWKELIVKYNQEAERRSDSIKQFFKTIKQQEKDLCPSLRKQKQNELALAQEQQKELKHILLKILPVSKR